jgi:hypothetical protein
MMVPPSYSLMYPTHFSRSINTSKVKRRNLILKAKLEIQYISVSRGSESGSRRFRHEIQTVSLHRPKP